MPSTIVDGKCKRFIIFLLLAFPQIRKQIILEINETPLEASIWDQPLCRIRIHRLKAIGFRIAFDDLPIAKASVEKLQTFFPDFVKLDHKRLKNLTHSLEKQELISLVLEFAENKIKLVLEGIETKEELLTGKKLGVPFFQGFYMAWCAATIQMKKRFVQ